MNITEKKINKIIPHIAYALSHLNNTFTINCVMKNEIDKELSYLTKMNGKKFYPTECIIGGIVSQEVVKCIAKKEKVNCNVYSYNPINENGDYFKL